jgi:SPP1 family predicted phage head-tail adaptor
MNHTDLYNRVSFQAPVSTDDGHGGVEVGWSTGFQIRAHFRYLRGSEVVLAARLAGKQPVVVTVPNCSDARGVTAGWRMVDARTGDEFNVRAAPVPTDDRQFLEVLCESGVAV